MDRTTWQCLNSFADLSSAFGTIAAIVVALSLECQWRRLSVRISNGIFHLVSTGEKSSSLPEYIQILVVNMGIRKHVVQVIDWRTRFFRKKSFGQLRLLTPMSANLRMRLVHGQESAVLLPVDEFRDAKGHSQESSGRLDLSSVFRDFFAAASIFRLVRKPLFRSTSRFARYFMKLSYS